MYGAIRTGDMDGALHLIQEFLGTASYCDNTHYEGHYQQLFYIIFSLFGLPLVKVGIGFDEKIMDIHKPFALVTMKYAFFK